MVSVVRLRQQWRNLKVMDSELTCKRLIIAGAGGHGKVLADIADKMGIYAQIVFLDDNKNVKSVMGYPVIGTMEFSDFQTETDEIIVAVGNCHIRRKLQTKYEHMGIKIATLIHPTAIIGTNVTIDSGTVIMAGAVINCDAIIGKGNIINTCASVDHECIIKEFSHISVGTRLCGNVHVGNTCWIGAGSVISNNISICSDCIIGVGAVVVKDIEMPDTYIGIPAKIMKDKNGEKT